MILPLSIPSPSFQYFEIGPLTIHLYALWIILGITLATVWTGRRLTARGAERGVVLDFMIWSVLMGIIGARLYHVLTSPQAYFGAGGHPVDALKIWQGGLGIWGAVAGGALGAWIACRRRGWSFLMFADSAAPGVAVAQAVGRLGNWFNQELFGRPTTLPWGLEIAPEHRPPGYAQLATYHPTFLYEALWCLLVAALVIVLDRRFTLDHGRSLALYVAAYTVGRGYFESLRIDPANRLLGLRINEWTSLVVGLGAVAGFLLASRAAHRMSHHLDPVSTD